MSNTNSRVRLQITFIILAAGAVAAPPAEASAVYNRQADFNAATNVDDGDNTHGGVEDPAGSLWSYQYLMAADRGAHGMDPAYFQDIDALSAVKYQFFSTYNRPTDVPIRQYTIEFAAEADRLMNYWYEPADARPYRMADVMAIFTVPQTDVYYILGELIVEQQQWHGIADVTIGTIQGGTFSTLMQERVTMTTHPGTQVVPNYTGNPNLHNLSLNAGDQIVFGVRGSSGWWVKNYLLDDQAFVYRIPEPATLVLLLTGLAVLPRRRRR